MPKKPISFLNFFVLVKEHLVSVLNKELAKNIKTKKRTNNFSVHVSLDYLDFGANLDRPIQNYLAFDKKLLMVILGSQCIEQTVPSAFSWGGFFLGKGSLSRCEWCVGGV